MKTIYICYLCFSSQDSFQNVLPSHNFSIVLATDGHANIDNISLKYSALSPLIADQHAVTQSVRFQLLTESVIDKIKTYVFFIGMARSGHSIVAAVLDAHPHIVISDELDVFTVILNSSRPVSKSSLFNQIWSRCYRKAKTKLHDARKGYTLAVDGLYQGNYHSYIDVIGDKHGGKTTKLFLGNPVLFQSHFNKLRTLIKLPIKVIHVIRNPYDNIATIAIYIHLNQQRTEVAEIKNSTKILNVSSTLINDTINYYFYLYKASEVMRQQFNLDTMYVHGKDLIANTKATVRKICDFLQVLCSDDYLNIVSRKFFKKESKTRYKVIWTNDHILKVKEHIMNFNSLAQYSEFNS